MKAWTWDRYGPPDVMRLEDVDQPDIAPDEVLVRVRATSVNPKDWRILRADPQIVRPTMGLFRPKAGSILGGDVAGVVERAGADVNRFRRGDEVYGEVFLGAFAEAVAVRQDALAMKPANLAFEQAAAVPLAAQTALQGLRDVGHVAAGQRVLINGAAGGIGTFAVQLAKAFDAEVTAVCSTRNVDLVRSLGADVVVDYTKEDFTERRERFDLLVDIVGNHSLAAFRRVLTPRGTLVIVGGIAAGGRLLGPAAQVLKGAVVAPFVSQRIATVQEKADAHDLRLLAELIEAGKVTPVIDRTYAFAEVPDAVAYVEQRHARGKVVVTV